MEQRKRCKLQRLWMQAHKDQRTNNTSVSTWDTAVLMAATKGFACCLYDLIAGKDAPPPLRLQRCKDRSGATPLFLASQRGHALCVSALLRRGADPDGGRHAESSLYAAAAGGHNQCVFLLLKAGAHPDGDFAHLSDAPLLVAAEKGHSAIVAALIQAGARVELRMRDGASPLYLAAAAGHLRCVQLLLSAGAALDVLCGRMREQPMHAAARGNHWTVVQVLLASGADLDAAAGVNGWTPVHAAAASGASSTLELLLEQGAEPDILSTQRQIALELAAFFGRAACVSLLLAVRPGPGIMHLVASLSAAAGRGHTSIVATLVGIAQIRRQVVFARRLPCNPLHVAAERGQEACLALLLQAGASPAAVDVQLATPLHLAAKRGHLACVRLLLAYGACATAVQVDMAMPLHLAASRGHADVVAELLTALRHRFAVDAYDLEEALYKAAAHGHTQVVKILLNAGTSPMCDTLRTTPLSAACNRGHVDCAVVLLTAMPDAARAAKAHALLSASSSGNYSIARMLAVWGAPRLRHAARRARDATMLALLQSESRWRRRRALALIREQRRAVRDAGKAAATNSRRTPATRRRVGR